jgi:hypothetical protein
VFWLGATEAGLGALVGALEFPEPSHGCRTQAIRLCPVQVIALAVIASLGPATKWGCPTANARPPRSGSRPNRLPG